VSATGRWWPGQPGSRQPAVSLVPALTILGSGFAAREFVATVAESDGVPHALDRERALRRIPDRRTRSSGLVKSTRGRQQFSNFAAAHQRFRCLLLQLLRLAVPGSICRARDDD
jgi:hypothetical protein